MNTAVINIKVDAKLKRGAQKVAESLGFSLSAIVKAYLTQLIKTKSVSFSAKTEEPSGYLIQMLKESQEDIKAGRVVSFKNGEEALNFLDTMIEDERRKSAKDQLFKEFPQTAQKSSNPNQRNF